LEDEITNNNACVFEHLGFKMIYCVEQVDHLERECLCIAIKDRLNSLIRKQLKLHHDLDTHLDRRPSIIKIHDHKPIGSTLYSKSTMCKIM